MKTRNTRKTIEEIRQNIVMSGHSPTEKTEEHRIFNFKMTLLDMLNLIEEHELIIESYKYRDAEVIDLDKAEELDGVDDSEEAELTKKELEDVFVAVDYYNDRYDGSSDDSKAYSKILNKINKMLKENR